MAGVQIPAVALTGYFVSASRPAFWGPPSLLSNVYRRNLTWMYNGRDVKLTTRPCPVPRIRMRGAIDPLPQYAFMAWYLVNHRDKFTFTLPGYFPGTKAAVT
jgi:hypothetical protein